MSANRREDMAHDTLAPWAESVPGSDELMTADELLRLPDGEWKYELVEGRLIRMTPTGLEHYYITDALHEALRAFVKANHLGIVTLPDTGFMLPAAGKRETVLSPDIAFVGTEKVKLLPARGTAKGKKYLSVVPDLAVEVASPDQFHPEMATKARLYLKAGVQLVWVVWPNERQVDLWLPGHDQPVKTMGVNGELDGLDVVLRFTYAVADLFA